MKSSKSEEILDHFQEAKSRVAEVKLKARFSPIPIRVGVRKGEGEGNPSRMVNKALPSPAAKDYVQDEKYLM